MDRDIEQAADWNPPVYCPDCGRRLPFPGVRHSFCPDPESPPPASRNDATQPDPVFQAVRNAITATIGVFDLDGAKTVSIDELTRAVVAVAVPAIGEQIAAASGVVKHLYSETDDCICCDGKHRYASRIEGIEDSGGGWLHRVARNLPDDMPVRVVVFAAGLSAGAAGGDGDERL